MVYDYGKDLGFLNSSRADPGYSGACCADLASEWTEGTGRDETGQDVMKARLLRDESRRAVHISKRWTRLGTREDTGKYLTKRSETPEIATPAPCALEPLKWFYPPKELFLTTG